MTCTVTITKGRGRAAKSVEMIEAMVEILEEIQPTSVRSVCYQLFNRKLIPDMSKGSTDKVGRLLREAREEGTIPWEYIVDESREAERIAQWDNAEQRIRCAVLNYRRDYWQDQDCVVEVWSEKGTVRGTLAPVLNKYGVTFRVMHGFASATVMNDIAEMTQESDKPLYVLYVGDYDPSGLYMSEVDLPGRLDRYGGEADIERIALTRDDVEAGDLPWFPASDKTRDPRHNWFVLNHGRKCWELDAMNPNDLRERVEDAILAHIDEEAWDHAVEVEKAEVESMRGFASNLKSILKQASKYSDRRKEIRDRMNAISKQINAGGLTVEQEAALAAENRALGEEWTGVSP